METRWVNRDNNNKIIDTFANKQYEGQEELTGNDPELNPPYADTIAEARIKKGKEFRKNAMNVLNAYQNSDITLTNAQINAYKAKLRADWTTTIKSAIDGLTTMDEIENYTVTWSTP